MKKKNESSSSFFPSLSLCVNFCSFVGFLFHFSLSFLLFSLSTFPQVLVPLCPPVLLLFLQGHRGSSHV